MPDDATATGTGRMAAFIEDLPSARRRVILESLRLAVTVPFSRWKELVPEAESLTDRATPPDEEEAQKLGLPREKLIAVLSSIALIMSFMRAGETDEAIADAMVMSLKLDSQMEAAIRSLLPELRGDKEHFEANHKRSVLANSILPSFESIELTVDIRVAVKQGTVSLHAPVVIALLDTDANDERLWFQMSKTQLAELKKAVDHAWDELAVAERWADQKH